MEAKGKLEQRLLSFEQREKLKEFAEQKAKDAESFLEEHHDLFKEQFKLLLRELMHFQPVDRKAYISDFFVEFLKRWESERKKNNETTSNVQM